MFKWGRQEVTFSDINGKNWREMRGARKIEFASSQCRHESINHVWIDTCCIDKSSSTELSEAINSMFSWYNGSKICYAYLEDVYGQTGTGLYRRLFNEASLHFEIRRSKWFTRGWTLQELIASQRITFFNERWSTLGDKKSLSTLISEITAIPKNVLTDPAERTSCSVARKMSWAASRHTTREEDMAYSLLGIFEVNMPLLYGEGRKAFIRLQEEILKETDDQSIFAWGLYPLEMTEQATPTRPFDWIAEPTDQRSAAGVLATHPAEFAGSANVVPFPSGPDRQPYTMTNKGLRMELRLSFVDYHNGRVGLPVALLDCHYENDFSGVIGIILTGTANSSIFKRFSSPGGRKYSNKEIEKSEMRTIYLRKQVSKRHETRDGTCLVRWNSLPSLGYQFLQILPEYFYWNEMTGVLKMRVENNPGGGYPEVTSTIVFSNPRRDTYFAIVIRLMDESWSWEREGPVWRKSVKIVPKPEGLALSDWTKECNKPEIDSFLERKHRHVLELPQSVGFSNTHFISAEVTEEEILNQKFVVLEIFGFEGAPNLLKWQAPRK